MKSLLYISETLIPLSHAEAEVRSIVAGASQRNAGLSVTGALLSTRRYFAQIVEGSAEAVENLMNGIVATLGTRTLPSSTWPTSRRANLQVGR